MTTPNNDGTCFISQRVSERCRAIKCDFRLGSKPEVAVGSGYFCVASESMSRPPMIPQNDRFRERSTSLTGLTGSVKRVACGGGALFSGPEGVQLVGLHHADIPAATASPWLRRLPRLCEIIPPLDRLVRTVRHCPGNLSGQGPGVSFPDLPRPTPKFLNCNFSFIIVVRRGESDHGRTPFSGMW
jgi:hypothetical protein